MVNVNIGTLKDFSLMIKKEPCSRYGRDASLCGKREKSCE